MKLYTEVISEPYKFTKLGYGDGIITFGSCFSENIASYLLGLGYDVLSNPFGILYNPLSISQNLGRLLRDEPYRELDICVGDGLYHSFDFHGSYSSADIDQALEKMNFSCNKAKAQIKRAKLLILTWGTAYCYSLRESGRVVANCHKFPQNIFDRRLYSSQELFDYVSQTLEQVFQFNPDIKVLTTISPIRHLRDTAHGNQLSKARLLMMNEELLRRFPERVSYFPSYEIVLDELRDYRFYADDLLHPSTMAVDIITKRLETWLIKEDSRELSKHLLRLKKQWMHRPLHQDDLEYELQREQLALLIRSFKLQHPEVLMPWFDN